MKKYQEIYTKLAGELETLKKELEIMEVNYINKNKELSEQIIEITMLEDKLEDLEEEKEMMVTSKKEKIDNIFWYISIILHVIYMLCGVITGSYFGSLSSEIIKNFAMTLLSLAVMITTVTVAKNVTHHLIVKSTISKIKNSEEYKKLIKEINVKEQELETSNVRIPKLKEEFRVIDTIFNSKKEQKITKEQEIESLKEEMFQNMIGTSQTQSRPLIKKKKIDN